MYKEIEDFRKEMQVLKRYESILWAISFHVHSIVQEEDVEMIKLHIDALQYIENENFNNGYDIKEAIKEGIGDLILIKDKCTKMGVI